MGCARIWRGFRGLRGLLFALPFLLAGLFAQGVMPARDGAGSVTLVICTGAGPMSIVVDGGAGPMGDHGGPCDFSFFAPPALITTPFVLAARRLARRGRCPRCLAHRHPRGVAATRARAPPVGLLEMD